MSLLSDLAPSPHQVAAAPVTATARPSNLRRTLSDRVFVGDAEERAQAESVSLRSPHHYHTQRAASGIRDTSTAFSLHQARARANRPSLGRRPYVV